MNTKPKSKRLSPSAILGIAIHFLNEGGEYDEATVLSSCSIELAESPRRGSATARRIDITLRCRREIWDKLKPRRSSGGVEEPKLMMRFREAIQAALPSGYAVANFGARARAISKPGSRYLLRREVRMWRIIFDGSEAILKHEKGLIYISYLLKHPPVEPIYGTELAALATGHDILQQATLSSDEVSRKGEIREKAKELLGVLHDDTAPESEKFEARELLEEMASVGTSVGKRRGTSIDRTIRAIRRSILRLHATLADARDESGKPHAVLVPFANHLMKHLLIPSRRYGKGRRTRTDAGVAGCFTYEPPEGVVWDG